MFKTQLSFTRFNRFGQTLFLAFSILLVTTLFATFADAQGTVSSKPRATFEKLWVDYDVTQNGEKGMRIHLKFTVYSMKNLDSSVRILFETGDGKRLRDKNKKFYATTGDVALFQSLKIDYDPGTYADLAIFMPYNEFDLAEGEYDLKMVVDLIYNNGNLIQSLTKHDFVFTQPEVTEDFPEAPMPSSVEELPNLTPVITYDKTWVDYDVKEGGKNGMRIHVKFRLDNMKGVDSELRIRVMRKSGELLKSSDPLYSNENDELVVIRRLKPGYQAAIYEDEKLFLPYEQLNVGKGSFNLQLDVDLNKPNGDLIKHMGNYDFVFKNGVD